MLQTSQIRVLFKRTLSRVRMGVFAVFITLLTLSSVAYLLNTNKAVHADTASTLNFQARLLNNSGSIVTDGKYNVQFKLYSQSSGGTALWTESYFDSNGATAGNDNRVDVKAGYLSVYLGSQTAFPGTINWDQDLYLTMNIGGTTQTATPTYDGEMSPRLKLTAVPYAFRASQLAQYNATTGFTSSLSLGQPTGGNQSFVLPDQGAAGTYNLLTTTAANAAYIQNQSASAQTANFFLQSAGASTVGGILRGAASQVSDLLQFQDNNGNVLSKFAANGQLTLGRITSTGTTQAGVLVMADGTTSNFSATLTPETLTADRKFLLPDTLLATTASPATICVFNGSNSNCPTASGSAFYIQNRLTVQDLTNFYIRSVSATDVTGVLEGANGQTADILDIRTFDGTTSTTVARFTSAGNLQLANSLDTATTTGFTIGGTNANAVNISRTGVLTNVKGSLTVDEATTLNGTQLTNAGATLNTPGTTISDLPTGGPIGTAAATVDVKTTFRINQTTSGQTLTLPTPTTTTAGRIVYVSNIGSASFTMHNNVVAPGSNASYLWNGTAWNTTINGGISAIGSLDAQSKSADGAVVQGSILYMQTADATHAGLVGTGSQTFSGDKTFNGATVINGPAAGSATALTVNTGASSNVGILVQGASSQSANLFRINVTGVTDPVAVISGTGAVTLQNTSNSATAFNIKNNIGNNVFTVDTSNGRVGINLGSSNVPASTLELSGTLRISGTTVENFTTPGGASVGTKINVPLFDPGSNGQILSLGLPSTTVNATSRVISIFDGRTSAHQPSLSVFSPNENNVIGLGWNGIDTAGYLHTNNLNNGTSAGVIIQSGNITNGNGSSGNVTTTTGSIAGGTGGSTGNLFLQTGNGTGTNSSSGSITVDTGAKTGTGTTGSINIGTTNASAISIASAGVGTTVNGSLAVLNGATITGPSAGSSTATTVNSGAASNVGLLVQGAASQTADLLQVKANGVASAVLGVSATGATSFRNSVDSPIALQVMTAAGSNIVSVSTSTGYSLTLGHSGGGTQGHIGTAVAGTYQGTSTNNRTFTFAKGVPVNHTIIGTLVTSNTVVPSISITDTKGNTYSNNVQQTNGSTVTVSHFSAVITTALTTSDTITITLGNGTGRWALDVQEFDNILTSSAVDQTTNNTGNSASLSSGTTATTTAANELVFGAFGYSSGRTFTAGSGFVNSAQQVTTGGSSDRAVSNEWKFVSATGTQQATGTLSSSSAYVGTIVTYKSNAVDVGAAAKIGFNDGSVNGYVASLGFGGTLTGNRNIYLPDASGTLCLDNGNCSAAGGYIVNGTALQTGDFNISGTGTVGVLSVNTQITNNGATLNTSSATLGNFASGGSIGSAATTVDVKTTLRIDQTTAGQTLSLPSPTDTTAGRVVYIINRGSASFIMHGITVAAGVNAAYMWNGTAWAAVGDGNTGVTTVGTIDSQTKSANGAVITGTSIVLQTADASNVGLVSTGAQTFAGAKTLSGLLTANAGITASGGALSLEGNAASYLRTTTGDLTLQAGSGTVTLGTSTALTASGTLGIKSGGSSNLSVDTGAGGTTTLSLGTTDADVVTISRTGITTTVQGALTVGELATFSGNITQSGTGTFSTGSGNVSLNGDTSITGTHTLTVGGTTSLNGTQLTNAGSTVNTVNALSDFPSGGSIGSAATTVDIKTAFTVNQTTAAQTLSLPSPTSATAGRIVYVANIGSASFTMHGSIVPAGNTGMFIWNGSAWTAAADNGVTTIGAIDSQTKSANGAVISGTTIYLQTADASNVGLVSTGAQTLAGAKTLSSLLTTNAGITASGGALSLEGNAASYLRTTTGNLTLQAGSGTVTLGTSTALTASGALSVTSGGSSNLTIDTGAGGTTTLALGTTDADVVTISRTGVTTTVQGALTVGELATFNGNITQSGTGTFSTGSGTISLNGDTTVTGTKNFTVNGGLTSLNGTQVTNAGSTLNTASALSNFASGGSIGSAASTVDVKTAFTINQTTAGQALTLPTPTTTTAGRIVYISNIGSTSFTMQGIPVPVGNTAMFVWNGSAWTTANDNGVTTVGAIDSQTKSTNGAVINGTSIYLQTADASSVGLVSTAAQTFAGAKTLSSLLTTNAGITASGGALSLEGNAASYLRTTSGNLTLQAGSGTVTLGTSTALTASGLLTITSGSSSNLTLDTGASGTTTLAIGTTDADVVTISRTGVTTTVQGALTVGELATFNGNITQSGTGTFSTGSGNVSLNGDTTVAGTKNFTVNGGLTSLNGTQLTNLGATLNTSSALGNFASGGSIGSAATTVDVKTSFTINQTTASQALTLPNPTSTAAGRIVYVSNIGSTSFTMQGVPIPTGNTAMFVWNGSAWTASNDNGVTTVGAIDSQTKSANGAVISGTTLYLQTADASNVGLVSTGAQTFAGAKTFNGAVTTNAGITASGGALSLEGNAASYLRTTTGNLTLQAGSGTVTLGTSTALTASGALTITSGASNNLTLDTGAGGTTTLSIGTTDADVVTISRTGITTTVQGALTVGELATFNGNITQSGSGTFTTGSGAVTLNGDTSISGSHTLTVGGTTTLNGTQLSNAGSTINTVSALGNFASGGSIGSAASTVDVKTAFTIAQTTASQTLSLPSPTSSAAGRIVYVSNIGSAAFTMHGASVPVSSTTTFIWNGSAWTAAADNGVTTVGAIDSQTKSTNGAVISGTTIYLQTADSSNVGLVSTGAQTLAGAKTLSGLLTTNAGITASGGALSLEGNAASYLRTTAGNLTLQAGSGTVTLGTSTSLTASGTLSIVSGTSSDLSIDTGSSGTTTLNLGVTEADVIHIGHTGITTTVQGALDVDQAANFDGNIAQTGATTFSTGTGGVTLNGDTGISGTHTLTVGGTTTLNGTQLSNAGSTLNTASALGNFASGGSIGSAASTVDVKTMFTINQTTASQTLSLPSPTTTTAGRIVYVSNIGSASFTMHGASVATNSTTSFVWNGSAWTAAADTGVTTVGAIDSQTKSTNGAVISGNTIYLQTADASSVGLVSTAAQTFAGAKTFNALLTTNAGITASGGLLQLEGNGASYLRTTTGDLTVQGGSGTVTLGTSTNLTASAALTIKGGASSNLTIDTGAGGTTTLNIGTTDADTINIGQTTANVLTTVNGQLLVKPVTDTSTDLRVQSANGNNIINIDTTTPNLITNNSFESGTTGWAAHGGASAPSTTTTAHYDGNNALSISPTAGGHGVRFNYALSSSTTYSFSVFVHASGSNFSTLEIGRSENGSADTSCATAQTAETTRWLRITCAFATGSVSGTTYVYVKQGSADNTSRTFYIDAVQLEAAGAPTVFRNGKVAIGGSLTVNGGQLDAAASTAALYVNALSQGNGLVVKGSGENNIFNTLLDVRTADDTTSLFHVNEQSRATDVKGGDGFLGIAALTTTSQAAGASALLATGASSATVPVAVLRGGSTPGSGADLLQFQTSGPSTVARISNSGNFFTAGALDTQTGTQLALGTSAATSISIGQSGVTTTNQGNLTTGTLGASVFTNRGATLNQGLALSNFGSNAAIGTAAATVDVYTNFTIPQTSPNITLTIPSPTTTTAGRIIYITNTGSASFTIGSSIIGANKSMGFIWTGPSGVWTTIGLESGVTTLGALDGQSRTANGASIVGNTLYLQTADASFAGLVSTGAQTLAGAKTLSGLLTANAGITASGGALSLEGNAASYLRTTTGNLTLQAGSGTVTLGTSTILTANANLTVKSTGANGVTVDTGGAASLTLGDSSANAVDISRTGVTTTIKGALDVDQAANFDGNIAQTGATTFSTGTGGVTLNGDTGISGTHTLAVGGAATITGITSTNGGLTNPGFTLDTASALGNFGSNGAIGTAAATVDTHTAFTINQTTASITLTIPSPTTTTAGRIIYVSNIGSQTVTVGGISMPASTTSTFVWNGSAWTSAGIDTGVTTVGAIDSQTKSTNGAVITGTSIVMQTADASSVGLVSTSAQTFGGTKTFNGGVTIAANQDLRMNDGTGTLYFDTDSAVYIRENGSTDTDIMDLFARAGYNFAVNTGQNALLIDVNGLSVARAVTDATGGFQVQQSNNDVVLNVSTNGNEGSVRIGNSSDVQATVFYLDNDATSDPSGASEGAMYYNTSTNRFRCFINIAWADCDSTSTIGTLDGQTRSVDGAVIANGSLFMQTADASNAGLIGTAAQNFAGVKTFNSGVTVGNSTGTGAFVNNGTTLNTIKQIANLPTGGSIGSAATTVDIYTAIAINQTTGGPQTITIPNPSTTTGGRVLYITNNGNQPFILLGSTIEDGTTATLFWNGPLGTTGNTWTFAGQDGSPILNQTATNQTASFRISGTGTIGGTLTLGASAGAGAFVNNGTTLNTTLVLGNFSSGGSIGGAATTVDIYTAIAIPQTTSGQTLTINAPTSATAGKILYLSNTGSTSFTLLNATISAGTTATLFWNGSVWTFAGADASSILNQNLTDQAANFRIAGTGTISSSSATAFAVQNAVGASSLTVDNSGTNVAVNGGGEDNGTFTTNWTAHGTATVARTTTSGEYASGTAGARVAITTQANTGIRNNFGVALTASSTYVVSFSVKSSTAWGNSDVAVEYYRNNTPTLDATCSSFTAAHNPTISTSSFIKYTCTLTTTSTAGNSTAFLAIKQIASASRTIYIDNLSVVLQNTTGAANSNVLRVGGPTSQGLNLLQLDSFAGPPQVAGTGSTLNPALLGSMYFDTTLGRIQCYYSTGWGSCGNAPDVSVNLIPEYTGAVLNGTGIGTMTADLCSGTSRLSINTSICSATEEFNYYKWTSPQATNQTYSIYLRYQLPATFNNFASSSTITLTARTSSTTDGSVAYTMYKPDGSLCGAATTVTSSNNTWQTVSLNGDETTCSLAANAIVLFKIDVTAKSNATVYASNLSFLTKGN